MTVTIYLIFLQLNVFTQTDNMAKRKGQAMLDRVSKMARALGEEKGDVFVPMDTALEENESTFYIGPQGHLGHVGHIR